MVMAMTLSLMQRGLPIDFVRLYGNSKQTISCPYLEDPRNNSTNIYLGIPESFPPDKPARTITVQRRLIMAPFHPPWKISPSPIILQASREEVEADLDHLRADLGIGESSNADFIAFEDGMVPLEHWVYTGPWDQPSICYTIRSPKIPPSPPWRQPAEQGNTCTDGDTGSDESKRNSDDGEVLGLASWTASIFTTSREL